MMSFSQRDFLEFAAWGYGGNGSSPAGSLQTLYEEFRDPDRRYSIRPFQSWNGKLEGESFRHTLSHFAQHPVVTHLAEHEVGGQNHTGRYPKEYGTGRISSENR